MKLSKEFFYTLRENANDEDSISGNLLVRGGFIKKIGNGIYAKMTLGIKTAENIKKIVRRCMNEKDASEVIMPSLIPIEIFEKTGRANSFGPFMFSLHDRVGRKYALGPTDEEVFALVSLNKVKSYKDLPYTIYQIGTKFRDEMRPRLGLIRTREFTMKDAYSFDVDYDGLDVSYQKMFDAYKKIFTEVGLNYVIVGADTGLMGGILSEEFQAISDTGEDILVLCDSCDYASNLEIGKCKCKENNKEEYLQIEELYTPDIGKIDDLIEKMQINIDKLIKTMIYKAEDKFYACMVAGNREVNETKLSKILKTDDIVLAEPEDVMRITNANIGFAGPIGLNIPIIMDEEILNMQNFVVGANKTNYHLKNVNVKDFKESIIGDIKSVLDGDICPKCGGKLHLKKGIEVGNTFKLGTKYSERMGLNYLGSDNELHPVVMGSYGIGIERIMAAIIEQNHDENGMIWPMSVAPFKVCIVIVNTNDSKQVEIAEKIYNKLQDLNVDTILDDRNIRVGVKFKDMDLIGIPIRITVGKECNENLVEFKLRIKNDFEKIKINEIIEKVNKYL